MPRSTSGKLSHIRRRKKYLKLAKGFRGSRSKLYKTAKNAVIKAGQHAYKDRKRKKGDFRTLWILRISGALKEFGLSYSKFINILIQKNIILNRKLLAELAVNEKNVFKAIVESAINFQVEQSKTK